MLYELLTGRPPFEFESLVELAAKQGAGVITPVRDLERSVPPELEATVMRCLARDPRFRPVSAAELASELGARTEVPTESLLATAVTEPLRSRTYASVPGATSWIVIAAAAAVALVAVILGVLRLGGSGSSSSDRVQPAQIVPPAHGRTPTAEARNLSAWLRTHSR